MRFQKEFAELAIMGLRPDDFMVVGSGPLTIRGIRDSKDLDIVVTKSVWEHLSKTEEIEVNEFGIPFIQKENVEILHPDYSIFTNSSVVPIEEIMAGVDLIEGFKFVNLNHLKKIKAALGRKKDLKDNRLIEKFLS